MRQNQLLAHSKEVFLNWINRTWNNLKNVVRDKLLQALSVLFFHNNQDNDKKCQGRNSLYKNQEEIMKYNYIKSARVETVSTKTKN